MNGAEKFSDLGKNFYRADTKLDRAKKFFIEQEKKFLSSSFEFNRADETEPKKGFCLSRKKNFYRADTKLDRAKKNFIEQEKKFLSSRGEFN